MSSLSRGAQPIGPVYNDLNREARKLKRRGYNGAAQELAYEASKQKLAGGESGITSSESNRKERDARNVIQSGLMRESRDSVIKGEADPSVTTAATGDTLAKRQSLYERMRGGAITPEMRTEATGLGVTDSGFAQASASAAKNPLQTAGAAPMTQSIMPGVSEPPRGLSTPAPTGVNTPSLTRPAAPPREGLIDGKPASMTLRRPADSEPGNLRGLQERDAAERSSVITAAMAASADGTTSRTRQDVVDEANKARVAAGKTPFDDSIYGEMSKMDVERNNIDNTKKRLLGKAQGIIAARADRAAAGQITAGMNSSTLPSLGNQGLTAPPSSDLGPVAPGRSLARPSPAPTATPSAPSAPTLTRPQIKSEVTTPNVGEDGFVSLEAPFTTARKKYRDEEAKGYKAPLRSATLALGSGLYRFGRDVKNSFK